MRYSQISFTDLTAELPRDPLQLVERGLMDQSGGDRSHAANIPDPDPPDSPQPLLLSQGEDGGELLHSHLSISEHGHLQPLDGSHKILWRNEGEVLVREVKLAEPQVRRLADAGEQGGQMVSCERQTKLRSNLLQLGEGLANNARSQAGNVDGSTREQVPQPGVLDGSQAAEDRLQLGAGEEHVESLQLDRSSGHHVRRHLEAFQIQVQVLQAGVGGLPQTSDDGIPLSQAGATDLAVLHLENRAGEESGVDETKMTIPVSVTMDRELLQVDKDTSTYGLQDRLDEESVSYPHLASKLKHADTQLRNQGD